MGLDLGKITAALTDASSLLRQQRRINLNALSKALGHLEQAQASGIEERRLRGRSTWLTAGVSSPMDTVYPNPAIPPDYAVVAVDGSHIDVDRHSPVRCFVINIGCVRLEYGEKPDAHLSNVPRLFVSDEDLVIRSPSDNKDQSIEGPILGALRSVMELEAIADMVAETSEDLPVLALLDGSLILWDLASGTVPDYVRRMLINDRLLPALDRLREMSMMRPIAIASQISLPRSTDVVNALRISKPVCGWDVVNCDANCGQLKRGHRNCDTVGGITDAELFSAVLAPGERSSLFDSTSSIVLDHYDKHNIQFCYLNLGDEVCRLELPAWATTPPNLDLAQACLVAQSQKGHGYPIALQEAHEQAVITGIDRIYFNQLISEMLAREGLPDTTSEKSRSKKTRFI